jgi:hypothetical protein
MSHLLKAVLLISMLAGIASAQAGERSQPSGASLKGLTTNGTQLNRLAFNGTGDKLPKQLNGVSLNSVTLR